MQKKQVRTTVMIDADVAPLDDWDYIRRRQLKPTNLLRAKIKELRERDEGAPTVEGLQANMGKLQKKMESFFAFLDEEKLLDKFLASQKN